MADATVILYPPIGDVTLQSSEVHDITLADAVTNTAPDILTLTHTTSGTATTSYGLTVKHQLESGGGTTRVASSQATTWTTATDGAEVSRHALSVMIAGTLTEVIQVNGTNGGSVRISNANADANTPSLIMNSTSGTGQCGLRYTVGDSFMASMRGDYGGTLSFSALGTVIFYTGGEGTTTRMRVQSGGNIVLCADTAIANNATAGFVLLPTSTTTGAPSGTPADFSGTHTPIFYNRADNKMWAHDGTAWKSVTFA